MTRRGLLLLAAAAPLLLAGCGKRGGLKPPPGEEAAYRFPSPYPKPETVLRERRPDEAPPEEQ